MNVTVFGMWHLGCVTAACLASSGHAVIGLDLDESIIGNLKLGIPPIEEPGLSDLMQSEVSLSHLSFTSNVSIALEHCTILWITMDTPVKESDEADVGFVRRQLETIAGFIKPGTLVLISSQVPVGFTRSLAQDWATRQLTFAYSPENLRLGKGLDSFRNPERVVLGIRDATDQTTLSSLFLPFCEQLIWMSVESAEMTKHAINSFLATSVTFINEIAQLCEVVGADAKEVERGLKSEGRIGARAYLAPGSAFAGGTLARDLRYLVGFGQANQIETPLFNGVLQSNARHATWASRRLTLLLQNCSKPVVSILGLTYTQNTNTLRRSASIELAKWLHDRDVRVQAYDPAIVALPGELQSIICLLPSAEEALTGADAVVIGTEWPAFRQLSNDIFVLKMRKPQVMDPNWFLAANISGDDRIAYFAIGKGSKA